MELLTTLWTDHGGLLTGSGGGSDELEIEGPGADNEDRW